MKPLFYSTFILYALNLFSLLYYLNSKTDVIGSIFLVQNQLT